MSFEKYLLLTSPYATLFINVLGCFLIGLLLGMSLPAKDTSYYFFVIGFLGSFTTMSAFSTQTMELINNYNFGEATLYILMTIGFTILATYIGLSIGTLK